MWTTDNKCGQFIVHLKKNSNKSVFLLEEPETQSTRGPADGYVTGNSVRLGFFSKVRNVGPSQIFRGQIGGAHLGGARDGISQDDNAPIRAARLVQSWFDEHEDEVQQLPTPTQSPNLNIIESLWSIFELSMRD
ncbi:DDE_3 domain-containing protein [Trichonephila clavipes]|nr:DDE_3 domain-containing protein [Trichonephila clavipes]